ncbi:GIY-YIG nuclease family protein [Candidatus Uhrbacteria bacterium]|nr:GIY-YIG nuclease family protein [Candidatus Uhrbacteria bacterium]
MYYVYALQSTVQLDWLYIGYSDDVRVRLQRHNDGLVKSTKAYRPFRLVYYEAYANELDARRRELELKRNVNTKQFLKRQINGSLNIVRPRGEVG